MLATQQASLPRDYYQTTTIVDRGDAFFATGWFIRHQLEASRRRYHWSQIIEDADSVVRHTWQLKSKSSAIVVLNARGEVQWVKEGLLPLEEVRQAAGCRAHSAPAARAKPLSARGLKPEGNRAAGARGPPANRGGDTALRRTQNSDTLKPGLRKDSRGV
ncbi:MAG: YtfJ family protein [Sodalis sp. (in: enterobacteria)]|uniref:YtfJ family protein n=1 Tax=Sodalis sp. (in: enterobacteria) TaxID=1898979 RepID=UPI003F2E915D